MSLILQPFDENKKLETIIQGRPNLKLLTSAIGINDKVKDIRLEIHYGLEDQSVAEKIYDFYQERTFHSYQEDYERISSLVLELRKPRLYQQNGFCAVEGYPLKRSSLKKILKAAREGVFSLVRLGDIDYQCSSSKRIHNGAHVIFRK